MTKTKRMTSNLAEARKATGLSQEKLAQEIKVSRETIRNIEEGTSVPGIFLALAIAARVEQPIETLFKAL